MDEQPLVTIAIPVYNEEKYIEETIKSALNQTYTHLEIIIADNCSTDTTFDIIQHFAEKDNRIIAIQHEVNHGASFNFKYPVSKATGTYFCWLGGHDVMHPDYIKQAVDFLNHHPNVGLVFPKSYFIDGASKRIEGNPNSNIHNVSDSVISRATHTMSKLIMCTAIHGLFHAKLAKELPFEDTIAPDHLMLFYASLYGGIHGLDDELYFRREIRTETDMERIQRYQDAGVFNKIEGISLYTKLVVLHLLYTIKCPYISVYEKAKLTWYILRYFRTRFGGVPMKDIIRYCFLST